MISGNDVLRSRTNIAFNVYYDMKRDCQNKGLKVHELHNKFDLFLKIPAKDLNRMRDIIENKIRVLPNILETELMLY
jgi:DNA-binding Lrp family transcriptional regulator